MSELRPTSEGLRVLSDISYKGKVKVPMINDHEAYSKIVVIDDNKSLKIANKPLAGAEGYSFSFSDFITLQAKNFSQFFPSQYHVPGNYKVFADIHFKYSKSTYYIGAHRKLEFFVTVTGSITNFKQLISDMYISEHSGIYYGVLSGNIFMEGEVSDTDISIVRNPFVQNTLSVQMKHILTFADNVDFNAFVKIIQTNL
jgi:hypothetical protein